MGLLKKIMPFFLAGKIVLLGACAENNIETPELYHEVANTDYRGNAAIENLTIMVVDESRQPLEGMTVHHLHRGEQYLNIVLDPQGRYFPARQGSNTAGQALRTDNLLEEIVLVLEKANESKILKTYSAPGRTLLEESSAVNKYCLSLEYMNSSYIDAPIGLIALLGTLAGAEMEELKIRTTTKLRSLFERYITQKYGSHEGYEVWVPKTGISLCGEQYEEVICPITTELLAQQLWNHDLPIWEIRGSCSIDNSQPIPPPGPVTGATESVSCDLPACVQYSVLRCQAPCLFIWPSASCILPCQTNEDCQQYTGYDMACRELSPLGRSGEKGCYINRCSSDCPPGFSCLSLQGKEEFTTASGAEPFGMILSTDSCYRRECL